MFIALLVWMQWLCGRPWSKRVLVVRSEHEAGREGDERAVLVHDHVVEEDAIDA
jgi:hypothetical protein